LAIAGLAIQLYGFSGAWHATYGMQQTLNAPFAGNQWNSHQRGKEDTLKNKQSYQNL